MKGALIGFGYWGQILAKNLKNSKENLTIFDISEKARRSAKKQNFKAVDSLEEILKSEELKFLIIAAAPKSHYPIVKKALEYNKHILVEKPFGLLSEKKDSLFKRAKKIKKVLMIDYSFTYSPGFLELKKMMKGLKLKSYESLRMNEQLPIWNVALSEDLLIHDLSMLMELTPSPPLYCICQSLETNDSSQTQTALISITGEKWRAFIYVSRAFSKKTRLVLVKSSKKAFEFKEVDRVNYIRPVDSRKAQPTALTGKSSLENMFEEFFNRISGKSKSNDELTHKSISSLLKAINQSLEKNGKKTKIQWL